jgi:hypothetical protein
MEAQLLHTDGRRERHDEASSRFSKFCATRLKNCSVRNIWEELAVER